MSLDQSLAIGDFISKNLITADEKMSLKEVHEKMKKHSISHIVVSRDNWRPIGILSDRDVRAFYLSPDFHKIQACDVMNTKFLVFSPSDTLQKVTKAMNEAGDCSCIVLDEKEKVVGIFTATDALNALSMLINS